MSVLIRSSRTGRVVFLFRYVNNVNVFSDFSCKYINQRNLIFLQKCTLKIVDSYCEVSPTKMKIAIVYSKFSVDDTYQIQNSYHDEMVGGGGGGGGLMICLLNHISMV